MKRFVKAAAGALGAIVLVGPGAASAGATTVDEDWHARYKCDRATELTGASYTYAVSLSGDNLSAGQPVTASAGSYSFTISNFTGTQFDWSSTRQVGAVVATSVAQGWATWQIYPYTPANINGTGLTAPYGDPIDAAVFCWNDKWTAGTAWAAGLRYTNRGSWATYSPYAVTSVVLYTGQTKNVGTVAFGQVIDGTVQITVNLTNSDARFADRTSNVHIQGYASAPSGNPSPGSFTTHKGKATGTSYSVTVPHLPSTACTWTCKSGSGLASERRQP